MIKTIFLLVILFNIAGVGIAQDSHIRTTYIKAQNLTRVDIDPMYILNTPEQAITTNITFNYPKQKLIKTPKWVNLFFKSFARQLKFFEKEARQFVIVFDGEIAEMGELKYLPFMPIQSKIINGRAMTHKSFKPQIKKGKVFDENGKEVTGIFEEMLITKIDSELFLKIANAKNIEVRIGDKIFRFTPNQKNSIQEFGKLAIP